MEHTERRITVQEVGLRGGLPSIARAGLPQNFRQQRVEEASMGVAA